MLADHLTSEVRDRHTSETTQRTVDVWTQKIGRPDNHLLDCMVGAAVAASIQGVTLPEVQAGTGARPAVRININEMQKRAREKAKGTATQ